MAEQKQSVVNLEIINTKNITDFEEKIWDAVDESDIPVSDMHFILQRIAHAMLMESFKDEDGS